MKRHDIQPTEEIYQKILETLCRAGEEVKALQILQTMQKEGRQIIRPHLFPLGILYIRLKEWEKVEHIIKQIEALGDSANRLIYLIRLKQGNFETDLTKATTE
jgi:pentatricopeptide repeat protein